MFPDYTTVLHNMTSVFYIRSNSVLSRNCTNRSLLGYGERIWVAGSCLPAPLLGKPLTPDQISDTLLQQPTGKLYYAPSQLKAWNPVADWCMDEVSISPRLKDCLLPVIHGHVLSCTEITSP